jgi:hypothetical protein
METSNTLSFELYNGINGSFKKIATQELPIIENFEEIAKTANILRSFTPQSKRSHHPYYYVLGEDVRELKRNGKIRRGIYRGFRKAKRFINGHSLNVFVRD